MIWLVLELSFGYLSISLCVWFGYRHQCAFFSCSTVVWHRLYYFVSPWFPCNIIFFGDPENFPTRNTTLSLLSFSHSFSLSPPLSLSSSLSPSLSPSLSFSLPLSLPLPLSVSLSGKMYKVIAQQEGVGIVGILNISGTLYSDGREGTHAIGFHYIDWTD